MKKYLFVGEKPSPTALRKGLKWEDGQLAAKQLFDALRSCGIDPQEHTFINLWPDFLNAYAFFNVMSKTHTIVAMGRKVEKELARMCVHYIGIFHPAARGAIRKKERYCNHVKEALQGKTSSRRTTRY